MTATLTDAEYNALCDKAHAVYNDALPRLVGLDCTATLIVIGLLLASVERDLTNNMDRDAILDEVCEIADACEAEGFSVEEDVH